MKPNTAILKDWRDAWGMQGGVLRWGVCLENVLFICCIDIFNTPGIFARENASSPFMMTCGILQKMLHTHI
jgi:hypothetical protein